MNLGPAAGPVQAITIALQLPIIETRVTILLGLARADGGGVYRTYDTGNVEVSFDFNGMGYEPDEPCDFD